MKFTADNSILVNSIEDYYYKEKCTLYGFEKPNTIRILSNEDKDRLLSQYHKYRYIGFYITVCKEGTNESFRRLVTDVTCFGEVAGRFYVVISWHKE